MLYHTSLANVNQSSAIHSSSRSLSIGPRNIMSSSSTLLLTKPLLVFGYSMRALSPHLVLMDVSRCLTIITIRPLLFTCKPLLAKKRASMTW